MATMEGGRRGAPAGPIFEGIRGDDFFVRGTPRARDRSIRIIVRLYHIAKRFRGP